MQFFRLSRDSGRYPSGLTDAPARPRPRAADPGPDHDDHDAAYSPPPARTVSELLGQAGQLVAFFVAEHAREPDADDGDFWTDFRGLVEAYQGAAEQAVRS